MPSLNSSKLARDRLQKAALGEPVEAWIYSAFQKDHWVARGAGDLKHAAHPGTALQIFEELYEIIRVEDTLEPGYAVRYGIKRWESHHTMRRVIAYTPESQTQAAEAYIEEEHAQSLRQWIVRLFFIAGLAPDSLQQKWEALTALNMTLISAVSALANIFIFMFLVQLFGRTPPDKALSYMIEYIGFDSFARLLWIVISGKPHGTTILSLPYLLWEAATRQDKRSEKKEWDRFALEGDEVIRRPSTGNLTVRSMLYDDWLGGTAPILFEGGIYQPLHWHEEGKGLRRRWVYEFEKMEANPKGQCREYTQPRLPARQKAVEEFTQRLDRAQVLAMIWGMYPRSIQLRLEARYFFRAAYWTSITAAFLLAGAFLQAWMDWMIWGQSPALVLSIYLAFESLYRLYRAKVLGKPAGSLVGLILGFFVQPPM